MSEPKPAPSVPIATEAAPHDEEAERREWWREAVTMGLYVSLSLLAVLVALPPGRAWRATTWA